MTIKQFILPHNLRPSSLKFRWTSNFVGFPQNSRIFSRIRFSVTVRLIVIAVLIASAAVVMAVAETNDDRSRLTTNKKRASIDSNFYLNEALKSLESGNSAGAEDATKSLSIALQLDPANPYALKLYRTLEIQNNQDLKVQINQTAAIISGRPDYAAAWLRLSILYRQLGDEKLSQLALEKAQALNIAW